VLGFDKPASRLVLHSYHPGQSVESVRAATGFELPSPAGVGETPAPTADELRVLRDDVYPLLAGVYPRFVEHMRSAAATNSAAP